MSAKNKNTMPNRDDIPRRLKDWFKRASSQSSRSLSNPKLKRLGTSLRGRLPRKIRNFDFKKFELDNVSEYSVWIQRGLLLLALFLLAGITSGIIGLYIRPVFPTIPKKLGAAQSAPAPVEDYDAILHRNVFNVEGTIPEPFDQGLLDCMSQAHPTTQRITLLGTIVMNDENLSVALLQDESSPNHIAVKKNDLFFDGKLLAMKVERKKLCFQVKASQELEFVEIPEDPSLGSAAPSVVGSGTDGITPVTENDYVIKSSFLQKNLLNLNEVLQTARAVPYIEPGTGKFKGFLVQSVDQGSPFAQLGIRQGDVLSGVNDIVLDNAGKGLEAFQRLRDSPKVTLDVIRGGQKQTLNYEVK